jgi:hypothetical protein
MVSVRDKYNREHYKPKSMTEKRKNDYVKQFIDTADKTWSDIDEFKPELESTAKAIWEVEGFQLNPMNEPATLPDLSKKQDED